ncbi:MAG: hypothetical protein GWP70_03015 [Proteobacteria bacterium]|nr:hypothetical protein [Pseudomonadota bacterium]
MALTDFLWRRSMAPVLAILLAGCAQITQETVTQGTAAIGVAGGMQRAAAVAAGETPVLGAAAGAAAADTAAADADAEEPEEEPDGLPSVASFVENMRAFEGFFTFYQNPDDGGVYLRIPKQQLGAELIYTATVTDGVVATGLFRGQYRDNKVVKL